MKKKKIFEEIENICIYKWNIIQKDLSFEEIAKVRKCDEKLWVSKKCISSVILSKSGHSFSSRNSIEIWPIL